MSGAQAPADPETCPICGHGQPLDIIAELDQVWVTAQAEAALPGYVCVVNKTHVREPFELPERERAAFWRDVDRVARAIDAELQPKKLNYEIHGNTMPHLHLHLFPRFPGDPFQGRPIDPRQTAVRTSADLDRLVRALAPLAVGPRGVATAAAVETRYVEIQADSWRFQPRVAAVCVWQDHVLLQRALDGDFWVLPGGRLLPLELTADALVRTTRWELGESVTVKRLLWVMEYVTSIQGRPVHELGFYHAIDLPPNSSFLDLARDHAAVERGHDLVLRWFPVDALPDLPLFPDFLRTAMQQMPDTPQHIVRVDIDARPGG